MSRRSTASPKAGAAAAATAGPGTGSLYGPVIDFKPGAALVPSCTPRPAATPPAAATGVKLNETVATPGFEMYWQLGPKGEDRFADPDLVGVASTTYILRIRVLGLLDDTERRNFMLWGSKKLFNSTTNFALITSYLPKKNYGAPAESWYQLTYVLEPDEYNSTSAEGLVDLMTNDSITIKELVKYFFHGREEGEPVDIGGSRREDSSGLRGDMPIANDGHMYKWSVGAGDYNEPQPRSATMTVRVERV